VKLDDAKRAQEVFVTSSTRELVWVSRWDDAKIGSGRVRADHYAVASGISQPHSRPALLTRGRSHPRIVVVRVDVGIGLFQIVEQIHKIRVVEFKTIPEMAAADVPRALGEFFRGPSASAPDRGFRGCGSHRDCNTMERSAGMMGL